MEKGKKRGESSLIVKVCLVGQPTDSNNPSTFSTHLGTDSTTAITTTTTTTH